MLDADQLQHSCNTLITTLYRRLTEDDKDLIALWSNHISDAPRPAGANAWHLLNIATCLASEALQQINDGIGEEPLSNDIAVPHLPQVEKKRPRRVHSMDAGRREGDSTALPMWTVMEKPVARMKAPSNEQLARMLAELKQGGGRHHYTAMVVSTENGATAIPSQQRNADQTLHGLVESGGWPLGG
jgi:hypothetical protein